MGSPIRDRFFTQDSSIDRERTAILLHDNATAGWLLSSPCTTTFSAMHLSKPRPDSLSAYAHSPSSMSDFEHRTIACRQTSKELQHRCSISSDSPPPGLTDDPFSSTSPNSDSSFEDIYNSYQSSDSSLEAEEKIWGKYFEDESPIKVSLFESPLLHNYSSYASSEVRFSPRGRTPISPDTFSPYPSDLHRSDAVRSTRDRSQTIELPRPQPQYSAFPTPQATEIPHVAYQQWSQRNNSRPHRPVRPRAKTAPSQPRPLRPSNLNVSVNNDIQYSPPTATKLLHGHRSAPPTPMVLPGLETEDIVEQFISYFDEDDDDDEHKWFGSFASRFGRRGSSNASGSWGKKSGSEKRKKSPGKNLRDALKGCFGKSK